MGSTYRSAMGKPVDMAALRSRNENVRAVGNMGVNAKGDVLDSNNNVVVESSQRVARNYGRMTTNPGAQQRRQAQQAAQAPAQAQAKPPVDEEPMELSEAELELQRELDEEEVPVKPEAKTKK